jgi:hypothetical protein
LLVDFGHSCFQFEVRQLAAAFLHLTVASSWRIEHVLSHLVYDCGFEIQTVRVNLLDGANNVVHICAFGQ